MTLNFEKHHGCGNDFIIVNNFEGNIDQAKLTREVIKSLCDRRYGVGADGLMILEPSDKADFKMFYANADGRESTMCGNGGRCIVAFAFQHGIINGECTFEAIDGLHTATIDENGDVSLGMNQVNEITKYGDAFVLDTGSPHYVKIVEDIENYPVVEAGRSIRNSETFIKEGINVNFIEIIGDRHRIRTYERGVEDETEACGTGVTAAAVVLNRYFDKGDQINLMTNGGLLTVKIDNNSKSLSSNITLCGPAKLVYTGQVDLKF